MPLQRGEFVLRSVVHLTLIYLFTADLYIGTIELVLPWLILMKVSCTGH